MALRRASKDLAARLWGAPGLSVAAAGRRGAAASAAPGADPPHLHSSMSDGFYDVRSAPARPAAGAPRPAPRGAPLPPGVLHDSLSGAAYPMDGAAAAAARRAARSPLTEPSPDWLHNSMSDGTYQMPPALRRGGASPSGGQGLRSARGAPAVRRVPAGVPAAGAAGRLQNSFQHGDYGGH